MDTLLLTIDCLRADHVGSYGYHRDTTPSIDALAADSTRYTSAYSNGPGTRFAFRSLLGGVYPLRLDGAGLPETAGTTLAESLSEAGYKTAGFANNPFLTKHFKYDRGFDEFYDVNHWESSEEGATDVMRRVNDVATKISDRLSGGMLYRILKRSYQSFVQTAESRGVDVGTTDSEVIDAARKWVKRHQGGSQPVFAWVHLMGVHHPYSYEPGARSALKIPDDVPHVRNPEDIIEPGKGAHEPSIDAYDANLRATDAEVSRLLDAVDEDMAVYLTGDHGEEFGRHTGFHEASPFQTMAHVPLLVRLPDREPAVDDTLVSHVDVPVSIATQGGATVDQTWDGNRLSERTGDDGVVICFETTSERTVALISGNLKLIRAGDRKFLFDLEADPDEGTSILNTNPERARRLDEELDDRISEILENRLPSVRPLWDSEKSLDEAVREQGRDEQELSRDDRQEIDDRLESLGYK